MMSGPGACKVLHVVATVGRGGVETWLCGLLTRFDPSAFQFDVCYYRQTDDELRSRFTDAGCRVFSVKLQDTLNGLVVFVRQLSQLMRNERYQAVHCHGMFFVGIPLYCAWRERIAVRVAHSHGSMDPPRRISQKLALEAARRVGAELATHRLGCSTEAAEALFGRGCLDRGASVLYCGVDVKALKLRGAAVSLEELGIPPGAMRIGCVANFTPAKNHGFLLKAFAAIVKRNETAHLILVGDGESRSAMETDANALGIGDRVYFLGRRDDVAALLPTFDVVVLPSLWEGLPLALIEAQAYGIPCVTSTVVTRETEVVPGLVRFIPLSAGPEYWAESILGVVREKSSALHRDTPALIENSSFDINTAVSRLASIYTGQTP